MTPAATKLKNLLEQPGLIVMPCCFDALSAKMIEQAGFPLTFMSGFAVSVARLGLPDTGLISYGEMVDQGRNICAAVDIPVIGDGDTGYGNALNVKRTVAGYAAAGFACAMIEDQVAPKRCGHTRGKSVVDRGEALTRVRAAVDARDEGAGILVMARTDARATDGFEEALWRAQAFADHGADLVFLEAPVSEAEMAAFCAAVPVPAMANMVEQGDSPNPAARHAGGARLPARGLSIDAAERGHAGDATGLGRLQGRTTPRGSSRFQGPCVRLPGFPSIMRPSGAMCPSNGAAGGDALP